MVLRECANQQAYQGCVVLGVSAVCLECGSAVQQVHVELASLVLEEAMGLPELFCFYSALHGLEEATCLWELFLPFLAFQQFCEHVISYIRSCSALTNTWVDLIFCN